MRIFKKGTNKIYTMIMLTIITQVFILIRSSIIASKFGVGIEVDAFNFANNLTTVIASFIGAGVTTILIPNMVKEESRDSINIFITIIYSLTIIIFSLMIFFRKSIIKVLSGVSDYEFITISSNLIIIMVITQLFTSITGVTNGILQSNGKFNRTKLVTLFTSVLMIVMLLVSNPLTIYKYNFMLLVVAIVNVIFQIAFTKQCDFKYKMKFDFKDETFRKMIVTFIPIILSTGIYQISLMIDTSIASRLGIGQVSILNYSNSIVGMLNMLFLSNIVSFLYPKIAIEIKSKNSQKLLFKYITIINFTMSFIVLLMFVLGDDAIKLLYERGKFGGDISYSVFLCLIIYIVSLPANGARELTYRYFYAQNDTFTPFKNSILASVVNIILSLFLSRSMGINGVVLGTTLSSYLSLTTILIRFKKKFGYKFNVKIQVIRNFSIILITFLSIIILLNVKQIFVISNIFIRGIVYFIFSSSVYLGLLVVQKYILDKIQLSKSN